MAEILSAEAVFKMADTVEHDMMIMNMRGQDHWWCKRLTMTSEVRVGPVDVLGNIENVKENQTCAGSTTEFDKSQFHEKYICIFPQKCSTLVRCINKIDKWTIKMPIYWFLCELFEFLVTLFGYFTTKISCWAADATTQNVWKRFTE